MFSTMKKKKIPKLLLTTIVKTDGLGDLSHFFDIDNYFATSDEVGEHDCERVVVCYKKNKEITIKRMKENGYQIIEFDENGHSLTEIDPNKKQVHLIVLDYVGDNTKINPFFEQHKELIAGLNYAISVSTNLFESEFITVNDFNKYFTPKNEPTYICCTEHAGKIGWVQPVTNGFEKVVPWGMGFCAEEHALKIEPRSDVEKVEDVALGESIEEELLVSDIGKSEISSDEVVEVRKVGKEEMEQDDNKLPIKARKTDEQLINFSNAIRALKDDLNLQMVRIDHFIVIAVNNSTGPFYVIDDTKLIGKGCFGSAYLTYLVDENDNINIKESEENLYVTKIISKGEFDAIAFESKCFNKKSGPSEPPIGNYDNLLIVSKYFPGFDLSSDETSPEVKALSFTDTANLLAQLAMAINLIHHHTASTGTGLFHGDIKGENIRVNIVESGNGFYRIDATLLDYGFSVKIQGSAITEEGIRKLQGTPVYLAPELHFAMGGIKSDIRSLVPVVLRLLRAIHPFEYKHSATNQLDYLYAKYDFSGIFTDMFKTPLFFFNGKCMDEQLKRLIIKFIEKMQHDDYGERPDSDELLQFFLALSNFCKTYQSLSANFTKAPTLAECSQLNPFLAKLTILSEGLWYHAIEPKTIANSQPDTFIKTFADYDFEALDTVARLIEPEKKEVKNAIGLDLNAMQQAEKAPYAAQENTKLTDIAFSKINSEIENYLGKSARFRNKQLLFYKQTLAEIFIANIEKNKSPLAIKNNLRTLQDLNYIFEELSDEKNQGIFPEQMDKETIKSLTTQLFNLIVAKGRDISAMDIFNAFHDQKDLIHLPFHFAIFHKLAEIAVRNSKEGYGKFYRPLFSSRLGTIVIKIKDIIDKEDSFEKQINQAAM